MIMISFYFQSFYRVMEARQTLDGKRGVITVIFEALKTVWNINILLCVGNDS